MKLPFKNALSIKKGKKQIQGLNYIFNFPVLHALFHVVPHVLVPLGGGPRFVAGDGPLGHPLGPLRDIYLSPLHRFHLFSGEHYQLVNQITDNRIRHILRRSLYKIKSRAQCKQVSLTLKKIFTKSFVRGDLGPRGRVTTIVQSVSRIQVNKASSLFLSRF